MRKLALLAIIVATAGAAYLASCNDSKTESESTTNREDSIKAVIDRGRYLAINVAGCTDCHSKRDFSKYSGPVVNGTHGQGGMAFDQQLAGIPGVVYARNITPDPETGIGTWTDDEILRAITQGINKNGDTLFPLMPYANYNRMAKEDLQSIIAYIRTLAPIKNKVPERHLLAPSSMFYPAGALQPSVDNNQRPAESDRVKYGEYLATAADCGTCHSPLTPHGPDMSKMYAGGFTFDLGHFKVTSANITPDSATGLGTWTEDRFLTKFTQYRSESAYNQDPGKENTIMPLSLLAGMTDSDLKAIYAYLRTVPAISNKVEKYGK